MITENYDQFDYFHFNRNVIEARVNKIMDSIREFGYIGGEIIVNKDFIVIDGQHRLEACKRLKVAVPYRIVDVDEEKAIISLNINQTIWKLEDYLKSWAQRGVNYHKVVLDFMEKYKLGSTASIVITSGRTAHYSQDIKNGLNLPVNPNMKKCVEFVFNCKEYLPFWSSKTFVSSVVLLFDRTNTKNISKLLKKVSIVKQQAKASDYLLVFENIINKNKKEEEKISLTL